MWSEEQPQAHTWTEERGPGTLVVGREGVAVVYASGAGRVELWDSKSCQAIFEGKSPTDALGQGALWADGKLWLGAPGLKSVFACERNGGKWVQTLWKKGDAPGWGRWLHAPAPGELWVAHDQGVERWCQF